jgi:hypothetical protein
MNKEQYWKNEFKKVVGYWFEKQTPNMERLEMILTKERYAENYDSASEYDCIKFLVFTRNHKDANHLTAKQLYSLYKQDNP